MAHKLERHIAFTGTREGLTTKQIGGLERLMIDRQRGAIDGWHWHHGCCQGGDAISHGLALPLGWRLIGHPPLDVRWMAELTGFYATRPPLPFLERNRALVDECCELVACPFGPEILHSGTWSTIRYARRAKMAKLITVIWPDGSLEMTP